MTEQARRADAKPTIDDVAAHAGVGRTTVSRVLNGGPNVRDEVRARVLAAVEALGYIVNVQARSLAGGSSRLIALIFGTAIENEPNSYYASAIEVGALRASLAHGCQVITHYGMSDSSGWIADIDALITAQRCSGIILTPPFSDDLALVRAIGARGCALVCISPGPEMRGQATGIGIDEAQACYDGARHLLDLGHRRFGFLKGLEGHRAADLRFDGFLRALRDHGLPASATVAQRGDFTFKSGRDLLPPLLDDGARPTALICANDDMAAGALFAAHQLGIVVPRDLSIMGFDDTPVSAIVWPPLTTIHQPIKAMGSQAVELLVARMNRAVPDEPHPFETVPHSLIVRQSTMRHIGLAAG